MLRFDPPLVLNASTLQDDFRELYSMSLAFILTKVSRKQPGPEFQCLKKAKIIQYTVITVICLIQRRYFLCARSQVYYSADDTRPQKIMLACFVSKPHSQLDLSIIFNLKRSFFKELQSILSLASAIDIFLSPREYQNLGFW